MSEVTFAKSFLATLDKRQIKLPADHVSDPRKYPNQSPFILPRQTHPFPRREKSLSTQQAKEKTLTATLKPMRTGETVTIADITSNTTIHDLKNQYAQRTSQQQDKIKLLLNKKPAADLKTLKELGVEGDVELSVMVMGGAGAVGTGTPSASSPAIEKGDALAAATPPVPAEDKMEIDSQAAAPLGEKADAEAQAEATGAQIAATIVKTEEFWVDLKGFLAQRLRDQREGERLARVFRGACEKT